MQWKRTLRINILTIFLVLIISTVTFVTSYSYYRQRQSILDYSKGTITRAQAMVTEKLLYMQDEFNDFVQVLSTLVTDPENLQDSETLVNFGLTTLKVSPTVSSVHMANEEGDFLAMVALEGLSRKNYFYEPDKALPKDAAFVVQLIQREEGKATSRLRYCDRDFGPISEQTIDENFDPRVRPWYVGPMKVGGLYWTDPYRYFYSDQTVIAVGFPLKNKAGKLIGAAGISLSLKKLANFLLSLKIGKTGIAAILDKDGNLIAPQTSPSSALIQHALDQFSEKKVDRLVFDYGGIEYLAGFDPLQESFKKDWGVIVVVPLRDFFGDLFKTQLEILIVSCLILIVTSILVYYFSKRISAPIVDIAEEINKITRLDFSHPRRAESNILEIQKLDTATISLSSAMRSFEKYIPKEIVRSLLSRGKDIELGGEKKDITILFTDIQGFTTIAEALPTDDLMQLLAEYFDALSKIILENEGTIDKYIGDSIMAFWGAPLENKNHTTLACKAALACKERVDLLNQERKAKGLPEFFTRLGLTTGVAIVGNIGTGERMNYTVIGDIVNTASRFQNVNKIYHTSIIISEAIRAKIQEEFLTRPLDIIEVKGRVHKTPIFELVAFKGSGKEPFCQQFQEAYEAFHAGDLARAKALFERLHQQYPEDFPTQMYLERLKSG